MVLQRKRFLRRPHEFQNAYIFFEREPGWFSLHRSRCENVGLRSFVSSASLLCVVSHCRNDNWHGNISIHSISMHFNWKIGTRVSKFTYRPCYVWNIYKKIGKHGFTSFMLDIFCLLLYNPKIRTIHCGKKNLHSFRLLYARYFRARLIEVHIYCEL